MKDSIVAREWLEASALTANAKDYAAHMNLVSKKVQVFGMPGFEVLGYNDWAKQSKHEFEAGVLKSVAYSGLKVQVMTPGRAMFKTIETVEANDNTIHAHGVEIILETVNGAWCKNACCRAKRPSTTLITINVPQQKIKNYDRINRTSSL